MTYHISHIENQSSKSASIVNPHSNPNGRDSRIILPGTDYIPAKPIEVNFIRNPGLITYDDASPTALNIYTMKDNWFFWDNGKSNLDGVGEAFPNVNIVLYNGGATNLMLTIDSSGNITF